MIFPPRQECSVQGTPQQLEIKVISPAFFSRFVHYVDTIEAFDKEYIWTDEKNRTVWINDSALLAKLLSAKPSTRSSTRAIDPITSLRWAALTQLRCRPTTPAYTDQPHESEQTKTSAITFSPLDNYVRSFSDNARRYQRQCIYLFISERFTFGIQPILDLLDLLIRTCLSWLFVYAFGSILVRSGFLNTTPPMQIPSTGWETLQLMLLHVWAFSK